MYRSDDVANARAASGDDAFSVLVISQGRRGAAISRAVARHPSFAGSPIRISEVRSVVTGWMDPAVLRTALWMMEWGRPQLVVEAVDDPEVALRIAAHALEHRVSIVLTSTALLAGARDVIRGVDLGPWGGWAQDRPAPVIDPDYGAVLPVGDPVSALTGPDRLGRFVG